MLEIAAGGAAGTDQRGTRPLPCATGHDERGEIVGEAAGGGLIAGVLELAEQRLQAGAVLDAGRFVERLPVLLTDAFARITLTG